MKGQTVYFVRFSTSAGRFIIRSGVLGEDPNPNFVKVGRKRICKEMMIRSERHAKMMCRRRNSYQ